MTGREVALVHACGWVTSAPVRATGWQDEWRMMRDVIAGLLPIDAPSDPSIANLAVKAADWVDSADGIPTAWSELALREAVHKVHRVGLARLMPEVRERAIG